MLTTMPHRLDGPLLAAHKRGLSQRDVAAQIGVSQRWVCGRLAKLGLPPNGYASEASRSKRSQSASLSHDVRRVRDSSWRSVIDLAYPVVSGPPLDSIRGYHLFAALCRDGWPIHADGGFRVLGMRRHLLIRCQANRVPDLPESSRVIDVGAGREVALSSPRARPIVPAASLRSHAVTIKGAMDGETMGEAVRAQLARLGITGVVAIGARRVLRINAAAIVGYEVSVAALSPLASVRLQAVGVGGRGRFGCGVFLPC